MKKENLRHVANLLDKFTDTMSWFILITVWLLGIMVQILIETLMVIGEKSKVCINVY